GAINKRPTCHKPAPPARPCHRTTTPRPGPSEGAVVRRTLLALTIVAGAVGGMTLAQHDKHDKGGVKTLSWRDIPGKLEGRKAKATTVEVTLGPGQASAPPRPPGPVFGYVLEGEYEWAIDDNKVKVLKVGDTFYEPTGCLHRVSKNPSKKGKTRVLAV